MSPLTSSASNTEPLQLKPPREFAALRDLLRRAGYTHGPLCHRLGIDSIYDFGERRDGRPRIYDPEEPCSLLVRLFLEAEQVPWSEVDGVLGQDDLSLLESFGLIEARSAADCCVATVLLYPIEELWIVSDRSPVDAPRTEGSKPAADIVYPAMTRNTQRFVSLVPRIPCNRFLELCAGTGIAALIAARGFARQAWAVDITERATLFARFNAALNDIGNITALEGDLYAPLGGERFDVIVAHPPYMPALETEYIFRDGGPDGERVTWGIFEGVADHLRPGGLCLCDCLTSDREGASVESRIREALGAHEREFDIIVAEVAVFDPAQYCASMMTDSEGTESFESIRRRWEVFASLGVQRLVFAAAMLRRRADGRPGISVRRRLSPETRSHDLLRVLDWRNRTQDWTIAERRSLLDAKLRANPHLRLRATHHLAGGQWDADTFALTGMSPFLIEGTVPSWFPQLLAWMDGEVTGREHLEHLESAGDLPDDLTEDDFADALYVAIDSDYAMIVSDAGLRDQSPEPSRQT